jgi:glycosidase
MEILQTMRPMGQSGNSTCTKLKYASFVSINPFYLLIKLRAGGDVAGFVQSLDYLQSMGIKAIYVIGSLFQGLPWSYDGYSAT